AAATPAKASTQMSAGMARDRCDMRRPRGTAPFVAQIASIAPLEAIFTNSASGSSVYLSPTHGIAARTVSLAQSPHPSGLRLASEHPWRWGIAAIHPGFRRAARMLLLQHGERCGAGHCGRERRNSRK